MRTIIIIGGGITGCVAAHELARLGNRVRLFEKRNIAAMASGWTLGGVRQSGRHPAELPMARHAVSLWPTLADRLQAETGYHQQGNIRLARTPDEVASISKLVEDQRQLGLSLSFLENAKAVRDIAPAVSEAVLAASFCPTDGFADPVAATQAFAFAARQRGADLAEGVGVQRIVVRQGRVVGVETDTGFVAGDAVVVAAGIHSPSLLKTLGLGLPFDVTLVQVALSAPVERSFHQVFGVANADCAGRQQPDGRFRYTSGLETYGADPESWSEASLRPSDTSMAALRERVGIVLPAVAETPIERAWGGLIDLTPDHLPVLDRPGSVEGLIVAAGFSGHGFGIAPVTGGLVAELALGEAPSLDLDAFRLDRFTASRGNTVPLALHG